MKPEHLQVVPAYIERAQARLSELRKHRVSGRELARALDISHTSLNHMKLNFHTPSEELMVRIADAAGIDRSEALADLRMIKAKSDELSAYWASQKREARARDQDLALLDPVLSNADDSNIREAWQRVRQRVVGMMVGGAAILGMLSPAASGTDRAQAATPLGPVYIIANIDYAIHATI